MNVHGPRRMLALVPRLSPLFVLPVLLVACDPSASSPASPPATSPEQRRRSTMLVSELDPDLDAGHDLAREAHLEVEDQPPCRVVYAVLDPMEEIRHRRHDAALTMLGIETSRDRVPQRRRAPLLSGSLEQAEHRPSRSIADPAPPSSSCDARAMAAMGVGDDPP